MNTTSGANPIKKFWSKFTPFFRKQYHFSSRENCCTIIKRYSLQQKLMFCRASHNTKKNFKVDASLTQFMEEKFVGENLTFEK